MAHVENHLSVEDLAARYRACEDVCSARHFQTIWLLAQGHTVPAVSAMTSFVPRWIEELLARYNALFVIAGHCCPVDGEARSGKG